MPLCEIAFSHSINAMQRRQITDGSRKRKTLFLYFNAVIRIIMGAPRFTNPLPPACGPHLERLKPQLHIVSPYLTDPSTVRFRTYIFCILYVVLHSISTMDWKKIMVCEKIIFEYRVYILTYIQMSNVTDFEDRQTNLWTRSYTFIPNSGINIF